MCNMELGEKDGVLVIVQICLDGGKVRFVQTFCGLSLSPKCVWSNDGKCVLCTM